MEAPRVRLALAAYLRQEGICPYCLCPVTPKNATWEHVIPKSWGGLNGRKNVILACQRCNSVKSVIESFISNEFSRELDMGSRAALFVMRCMKLNGRRKKKVSLPKDTYLRMAVSVQVAADAWIQKRQVTIPEMSPETRGAFI